jgi:hypothetical protein
MINDIINKIRWLIFSDEPTPLQTDNILILNLGGASKRNFWSKLDGSEISYQALDKLPPNSSQK